MPAGCRICRFGDTFVSYGNYAEDKAKVVSVVTEKSWQGRAVPTGAAYVVALKSEKESIEEWEFYGAAPRVDDPVLAHAGAGVGVLLLATVVAGGRGRRDLDDEVGHALHVVLPVDVCRVPGPEEEGVRLDRPCTRHE